MAAPAGGAGRHRAGPGDPGLAAGAGIDPGAVRLHVDRARRPLRLPLVPRGAFVDGMAWPAAGDRLGPIYPPPRARAWEPAGPGRPAMTAKTGETTHSGASIEQ